MSAPQRRQYVPAEDASAPWRRQQTRVEDLSATRRQQHEDASESGGRRILQMGGMGGGGGAEVHTSGSHFLRALGPRVLLNRVLLIEATRKNSFEAPKRSSRNVV